jgi:cytochrome c biogenesis protein CcmG/thiol:disulfide interchange protein DsbE
MSGESPPEVGPSSPPMFSGVRLAAAVVGVVLVAFVVLLATSGRHENPAPDAAVGQAVPLVAGESYNGEAFDLEDVLATNRTLAAAEQEWVVINFFASWCVPCQVEHPDLVRFDSEGTTCPTRLVGVSIQDTPERVGEFFDERGGDWPVLVGDNNSTIIDFGVTAPPETFVVTPAGIIGAKFIGPVTYDDLVGVIPC